MLNAKAITAAKKCISVVESELGIKLKLSHPDFLELLVEYAELNDSQELQSALAVLAQFAPANVQAGLTGTDSATKIVNLEPRSLFMRQDKSQAQKSAPVQAATPSLEGEATVLFKGKMYPRYRDGMEFKGLYRGQPRYA